MRTIRVGDHALLVVVEGHLEAVAAREVVMGLAGRHAAAAGDLAAPADVVPAACTVLVDGLPDAAAVEAWRGRLAGETLAAPAAGATTGHGREVTVDMTYDGLDLDFVADSWGCSVEELVARHQNAEFLVAFCGFAPGFAYCTATPALPETARRPEPRTRVPAGSVALAGEYCGVYPSTMPGGWQLIGTTTATLFDPGRAEPALLTPGDTVRFRAV